jgi:hypothetical protein
MANTYVQIGSTLTVGVLGAASFDFTSIPSTYTDLIVKVSARTIDAINDSDPLVIRLNGSSSNLSARALYGTGSAAASLTRASNSNVAWTDTTVNTASTFGSAEWYIPNYAGGTNKSISVDSAQENNATAAIAAMSAVLWSNTAAITQITILSGNGYNLAQYSTATLYGIKKN